MFGEFGDKVVLIVLGVIIPPIIAWITERAKGLSKFRIESSTVRMSLVSMASLALTLLLLSAYDRGYLPFVRVASSEHVKYEFGKQYQNETRGTIIVTVSAINKVPAFTMCAAVAEDRQRLLPPKPSNCANEATVAAASFSAASFHSSMTFVVPRGYWYSVTTDGGDIVPTFWTQYAL